MLGFASQALCECGCVLTDPQLIGRRCVALGRKGLHGAEAGSVVHAPQQPHIQRRRGRRTHSTTFTAGWAVRARYRLSSCSRLVAVTVIVPAGYLPVLLGRSSTVAASKKGSN